MKTNKLKTRQQKRREKRLARKSRNIFETGLESLEVPRQALDIDFTTTESLMYQVMLLDSHRSTGRLARRKVSDYMERTHTKSSTSIYAAIAGLNEKGIIEATVDGWVTGTVILRYQNQSKDENQIEIETGEPLGRALVHRQALKLMAASRLGPLAQKLYWYLAMEIDLQTGRIHFKKIKELANFFKVTKAAIYKSIRQLNAAGLGSLEVDYGLDGHLEHVALAYGVIALAIEKKKSKSKGGINARHADSVFASYRKALYELFGVPIEALTPSETESGIHTLKDKLKPVAEKILKGGPERLPEGCTDWESVLAGA